MSLSPDRKIDAMSLPSLAEISNWVAPLACSCLPVLCLWRCESSTINWGNCLISAHQPTSPPTTLPHFQYQYHKQHICNHSPTQSYKAGGTAVKLFYRPLALVIRDPRGLPFPPLTANWYTSPADLFKTTDIFYTLPYQQPQRALFQAIFAAYTHTMNATRVLLARQPMIRFLGKRTIPKGKFPFTTTKPFTIMTFIYYRDRSCTPASSRISHTRIAH